MSDGWQEAEEKLRAGLAYRAAQREIEHQAARAKAAEARLAEAVALLIRIAHASSGPSGDAVRAFLAQSSEKKESG